MDGVMFLFDLAILLFAAKMLGLLARKIGAPEVVGEILAGLLLGPAVFGLVKGVKDEDADKPVRVRFKPVG